MTVLLAGGLAADETLPTRGGGPPLLPLKSFQDKASETIVHVVRDTAAKIEAAPSRRRDIALAQGVTLLRSPTGSGKTLTLGRTLERMVGNLPRRCVWFWFTPFAGLVTQTRDALAAQCSGLRLRDIRFGRNPGRTMDGDVFVTTWASVSSATKEAKLARQPGETQTSIDLMVEALREGWYIGAVIDEAHLNFGTGAKQAAQFYLDVLRPDFTLLSTATPRDEELERFERFAKIERVNRVEIGRDEAVRACLNKTGVKAIHFRPEAKDENVLDMEEVAIYAGLARHRMIKQALEDEGVGLVPLLMIQVENEAKGERDPVEKVREFLLSQRVPKEAIAVHTSGEPDRFFHTLAYDEEKEVLIFKVAAATGFDAPRAWTLVSLRKTIGAEFGHQVLGRIMRVHPRVQHLHPFATTPSRASEHILDSGYLFLANPAQQHGIAAAAFDLKAIRDSVETVTDNVVIVDFGDAKAALLDPKGGFAELLVPPAHGSAHADPSIGPGPGDDAPVDGGSLSQVRAAALLVQRALALPAAPDGGLPASRASETSGWRLAMPEPTQVRPEPGLAAYRLRDDVDFPRRLAREVMPKTMDGLVNCIAQRIQIDDGVIAMVDRTFGKVVVTEEDVFGTARRTSKESVPLSGARIAQQAQMSFRFNEGIDVRDLKSALLKRLRQELDERGHAVEGKERELRRAVDLLAMTRPEVLHDACRACLAQVVEIRQDEEIPAFYEGPAHLERAEKSLYGIFPTDRMNGEELAFARLLDEDKTGTVRWWLRNEENTRWGVSIVLPNGRRHFPDFIIGVDARRRSLDGIALAEVKDDGRTGRLFSTVNRDKVRTEHREYRSAIMVVQYERGEWFSVAYRPEIQSHQIGGRFSIEELVYTQ